jgi:hypothetical protein
VGQRKTFTLNTEPHVAELGNGLELKFQPEVMGDAFLEGYVRLQEAYRGISGGLKGDGEGMDPAVARNIIRESRRFLHGVLLPESQEVFSRYVVVKGGKAHGVYQDPDRAAEAAAELGKTAEVRDDSVQLPLRALMEILEWVGTLYGGNDGARPTGPSTASSSRSPRAGRRGTGSSPSKG